MVENIRLSLKGIWSHRLRSFLTMLGIIIGIAAIIAIVSTIKGTNDQIQKNLIGSGKNTVTVSLQESDWDYDMSQGIPAGIPEVSDDTRESLAGLDHVESVSLYKQRQDYQGVWNGNVSLEGGTIYGIDDSYLNAAGLAIAEGRGISLHDREERKRTALLDETALRQLFPDGNAIGRTVEIHSVPYTVVGVVREREAFEPDIETMEDYYTYVQQSAGKIYIPDSTWPSVYQYDEPQNCILKTDSTNAMTEVGKSAAEILNAGILNATGNVKYQAKDLLQQAKEIQQLSESTNTMLIWIAGISLLVGGIGVMNIMLVSVTERTGEIGLKKAIGARKKAILTQFLTEATVLTMIGGILGVITGILLAYLISKLNGTPVSISVEASIFAVLFSMVIGIVFGLLPSYKAANLDPIEALRRE